MFPKDSGFPCPDPRRETHAPDFLSWSSALLHPQRLPAEQVLEPVCGVCWRLGGPALFPDRWVHRDEPFHSGPEVSIRKLKLEKEPQGASGGSKQGGWDLLKQGGKAPTQVLWSQWHWKAGCNTENLETAASCVPVRVLDDTMAASEFVVCGTKIWLSRIRHGIAFLSLS